MNINVTLIGQMITFAIFVWFTMKFVWPPLKKAMEERKNKISEGLASADRAEKELEIARRDSNEILHDAKAKATKIIEHAHIVAIKIDEEAKEQARIDSDKIIKSTYVQIEAQKSLIKDELRKDVVRIAISGAEKIILNEIDSGKNKKLLEQIAVEL